MSFRWSLVGPTLAGIAAAAIVTEVLVRSPLLGTSLPWEIALRVAGYVLAGGGVGVGLVGHVGPPRRWLRVSMFATFAGVTASAIAYDSSLVACLSVLGFGIGLLLGDVIGSHWDPVPEPEPRNPVIRDAAAAGRALVEAAADTDR